MAVGFAGWLEVIGARITPVLFCPHGDSAALLPVTTLTVAGLAAGAVALAARRQRAGIGLELTPG